ncbi:hypothetical protein J2736_002474 [Paenibacillus qinlingensis]|uniref:Uncharacterized protein n=1 Tax=Paenibacillus qinlingensis TaxID=1837343 RepID=A0ABU1NWQ7_9BACL|nr:hypothetical protein [Paenibacillus qinlingensis]
MLQALTMSGAEGGMNVTSHDVLRKEVAAQPSAPEHKMCSSKKTPRCRALLSTRIVLKQEVGTLPSALEHKNCAQARRRTLPSASEHKNCAQARRRTLPSATEHKNCAQARSQSTAPPINHPFTYTIKFTKPTYGFDVLQIYEPYASKVKYYFWRENI